MDEWSGLRYEVSLTSRYLDGDGYGEIEDEDTEEEMTSRNQRGDGQFALFFISSPFFAQSKWERMNIQIAASGRKRKAAIKAVAKTRGKNLSQKTVTWVSNSYCYMLR